LSSLAFDMMVPASFCAADEHGCLAVPESWNAWICEPLRLGDSPFMYRITATNYIEFQESK